MGFFSWKTADTNETIWNTYTKKHRPIYLLFPDREPIKETSYDGYGRFSGQDVYEILAKENGLGADRSKGIELYYNKKEYKKARFHLKFSFDRNANYKLLKPSKDCPVQGYF